MAVFTIDLNTEFGGKWALSDLVKVFGFDPAQPYERALSKFTRGGGLVPSHDGLNSHISATEDGLALSQFGTCELDISMGVTPQDEHYDVTIYRNTAQQTQEYVPPFDFGWEFGTDWTVVAPGAGSLMAGFEHRVVHTHLEGNQQHVRVSNHNTGWRQNPWLFMQVDMNYPDAGAWYRGHVLVESRHVYYPDVVFQYAWYWSVFAEVEETGLGGPGDPGDPGGQT